MSHSNMSSEELDIMRGHFPPLSGRNEPRGSVARDLWSGGGAPAVRSHYGWDRGRTGALFPLTPALSPGERENSRQPFGESAAVGKRERPALLLPLPEGEGRGEREQDAGPGPTPYASILNDHQCNAKARPFHLQSSILAACWLTGMLLLFMNATATACPRDAQCKLVEKAVQQGLPRTAITNLEPIIAGALKDKAYPEAVKAIGEEIALEGNVEGNKPEERITRLEAEIAKAPKEMAPMMETLLAH